jgi:hypothetical protein
LVTERIVHALIDPSDTMRCGGRIVCRAGTSLASGIVNRHGREDCRIARCGWASFSSDEQQSLAGQTFRATGLTLVDRAERSEVSYLEGQ